MPQDRTPAQRDNHLVVVRRVRNGLISVGVFGSLAVAGFVAATSHPAATTTTPAATGDSANSNGQTPARDNRDDSFSQWRAEGDAGERSDDGARSDDRSQGPLSSQGQQQSQPPALQPGVGSSHGSSGGS